MTALKVGAAGAGKTLREYCLERLTGSVQVVASAKVSNEIAKAANRVPTPERTRPGKACWKCEGPLSAWGTGWRCPKCEINQ